MLLNFFGNPISYLIFSDEGNYVSSSTSFMPIELQIIMWLLIGIIILGFVIYFFVFDKNN